jgi:hypothetical protein
MFYKNDDETNIIEFGHGDVNVIDALADDPDNTIGMLVLEEGSKRPIGESWKYSCDKCMDVKPHTSLVFNNVQSLDVVLKSLQRVKDLMLKD